MKTQASSSNGESTGLQIRGLGVRIPPGLPFCCLKMPKKKREKKKEVIKTPEKVLKTVKSSSLSQWEQITQFLRETKVELKKVTWPSKKELIGSTVVVIIFVLLIAAYFGIIDLIYTTIIGKLLG